MRFIDEAKITVKAGDGGPGIIAWRREKFVPLGGPAGGNGGRGGDVFLEAKGGMNSLLDLKQAHLIHAGNGTKGRSKNQAGRTGTERVVFVPVGTLVKEEGAPDEHIVADLTEEGQRLMICRGGDGGFGNSHFKSPLNNAPDKATHGFPGEERRLHLTLKLMADVGLLGFPNAGKSTLLTRFSNARPKVADYPFTTIKPMVGVCEIDVGKSMVIADIPGLIEGSSQGLGLGHRFLRHLERVRILCHLIDATSEADLMQSYLVVNNELQSYSEELAALPQLVVLNKLDAISPEQQESIDAFRALLAQKGVDTLMISAVSGAGLSELKNTLYDAVVKAHELAMTPKFQKKKFDPSLNLY
jgi:GTP-binding protein